MLELRNLFIRDYSHLPIIAKRWLGAFGEIKNIEESLLFELEANCERAAEPCCLKSIFKTSIRSKTSGICLLYNSLYINSLYFCDVWSHLVDGLLYPKYNTDTFIEPDTCLNKIRELISKGHHSECFLKKASKPFALLIKKDSIYKEEEIKNIFKKNNIKLEIIKER